jgi:hypothetical protein
MKVRTRHPVRATWSSSRGVSGATASAVRIAFRSLATALLSPADQLRLIALAAILAGLPAWMIPSCTLLPTGSPGSARNMSVQLVVREIPAAREGTSTASNGTTSLNRPAPTAARVSRRPIPSLCPLCPLGARQALLVAGSLVGESFSTPCRLPGCRFSRPWRLRTSTRVERVLRRELWDLLDLARGPGLSAVGVVSGHSVHSDRGLKKLTAL